MKKWLAAVLFVVGVVALIGTFLFMYTLYIVDTTYQQMIESYKDPKTFEQFRNVPGFNLTAMQEYSIALQQQARAGLLLGWVWALLVLITSVVTIDIAVVGLRTPKAKK
jgi:uncharacterized membrane protein